MTKFVAFFVFGSQKDSGTLVKRCLVHFVSMISPADVKDLSFGCGVHIACMGSGAITLVVFGDSSFLLYF